jgi:O-antigen ligase
MPSLSPSLKQPTHFFRWVALVLLVMFIGNMLGLSWTLWFVGAAGLAACIGLLFLVDEVLCGKTEPLLLIWVAVFPLGYYFLSFPRADAIVSFDRVVVLLLGIACLLRPMNHGAAIAPEIRMAGGAWLLFLLAAMLSLVHVSNPIGGVKFLLDVFGLPAIIGYVVLTEMEPRRWIPVLHFAVCLFCIYSVLIGFAEVILDTDLLAMPGDIFYTSAESQVLIPRVNGPFTTNNSFALIGLIACVFICFLWRLIPRKPLWLKLFHAAGVAASASMAILPLYRSVFLTMGAILLIDAFIYQRRLKPRLMRLSLIALFVVAAVTVEIYLPEAFEARTNSGNIYQRIAQQEQTLGIFMANPLTGMGLGNFLKYAATSAVGSSFASYDPANAAHNNFGQILAETGILGAVPYLLSQVLLVWAARKLLRKTFAWKYSLYIFLTYWINGMALSSGYYQDLNIFFILTIATLLSLAHSNIDEISFPSKSFHGERDGSQAFLPA